MKPTLQLKFSQQLALTPQLQQAIRLLQLSQLELVTELRQLAESNPMLELEEDSTGSDTDAEPQGESEAGLAGSGEASGEPRGEDDGDSMEWVGTEDRPIDFSMTDAGYPNGPAGESFEAQDAAPSSLHDHLRWQLNLSTFSPRDEMIALALIDAIDARGYLEGPLADVVAALPVTAAVEAADVEAVRRRLQQFDPVGVASLDLQDCLRSQLRWAAGDDPVHPLALAIVDAHLELLARQDLPQLARLLDRPLGDIQAAAQLIRGLDPQPGAGYDHQPVEYVIPDVYVRHRPDGEWQVSLNPGAQPPLRINQYYCQLMAETRGSDASWMRGQLQEARWLLKSLEARSQTLLKVASAIVQRQRGFLDHGPEAMQPLVLREIAEEVDMHESTISRVTSHKYMHTPRGLFEFKHFFSSRISTETGDGASAIAIQALLRKLVDAENPRKPLSDQAIADSFQDRGIQLARRTVAKYRDLLRIPSSSQRQRAG
ncbi:RNA polymerase factor sigma-54 [Frateuria aurantia]